MRVVSKSDPHTGETFGCLLSTSSLVPLGGRAWRGRPPGSSGHPHPFGFALPPWRQRKTRMLRGRRSTRGSRLRQGGTWAPRRLVARARRGRSRAEVLLGQPGALGRFSRSAALAEVPLSNPGLDPEPHDPPHVARGHLNGFRARAPPT